jgi:hypothetical protein
VIDQLKATLIVHGAGWFKKRVCFNIKVHNNFLFGLYTVKFFGDMAAFIAGAGADAERRNDGFAVKMGW